MADNISALAEALYGASTQKAIAAENPYYSLGGVPSSISDMVLKTVTANPDKYSLKEALPYALGSGLLSGLLSTLGDSYQSTLTNRYQDAVMKSLLGEETSGEGLRPSLFKSAKNTGDLFRLQQSLSAGQDAKTFQRERFAKLQDKFAENGYLLNPDMTTTKIEELDPLATAAKKKAIETKAALQAENDFWNSDTEGKAAEVPIAKPATDEAASEKLASGVSKDSPLFQFMTANPKSPKYAAAKDQLNRLQGLETDTYNRITKLPTYTQFADIDANFKTLIKLSEEDSRPASVGMISSLARIWDPNGTVREGEYKLNAEAQAALDNIVGQWREIVDGKGRLSDTAKKAIISASAAKYNEFGQKYQMEAADLYGALINQGGNPANVPTPKWTKYEVSIPAKASGIAGISLADIAAERARRGQK